ncbi:hypothetical protein [Aridibaculum aurantiacum]|uniref:hypothetical protein n=1 Tax=Aridibaculum aurantiacum TaxID=2810307 RepID=UPI001A95974F|nr:hypothetical protein [Aridibaculum aurantiacum]
MSFENIQLPEFLLADLYKDCLVELENIEVSPATTVTAAPVEVAKQEAVAEKTALKYLGENKRNVAILVKSSDAAFVTESDLQFLTNVLKACQLNLADIAIVNTDQQPVQYNALLSELKPKHVILFDVEPAAIKLPFAFPDFQPQSHGDIQFLKAPALNNINLPSQDAKVLKTKLWISLQKIFGLTS